MRAERGTAMAVKYYAVRCGVSPGVYETWEECRENVHGYPGAVYKSFPTRDAAEAFAKGQDAPAAGEALPDNYAFVDGSFNPKENTYGYGGFLVCGGKREVLQGSGRDEKMASMRNVAGEILGSRAAIERALELGIKDLTIYYDYQGIESWATGAWKREREATAAYHDFVQSAMGQIKISFSKVKGHSGVEGNEEADRLAREAVGIA